MSQETEYSGEWWLPSNPATRASGRLDLSGQIMELTLDGALLPTGGAEQDFPVIHGRDRGGFDLTLVGPIQFGAGQTGTSSMTCWLDGTSALPK